MEDKVRIKNLKALFAFFEKFGRAVVRFHAYNYPASNLNGDVITMKYDVGANCQVCIQLRHGFSFYGELRMLESKRFIVPVSIKYAYGYTFN